MILDRIKDYSKVILKDDNSGHDYYHAERVSKIAKRIAEKENANIFLCEVAAFLHDVIDYKVVSDEAKAQKELIDFLRSISIKESDLEHILYIINNISFNSNQQGKLKTLEAMIVQDADRLDAIGAIGIARTMIFTGAKKRILYDPNIEVREAMTKEEYRSNNGTTINHFYEKLLKLKDLMNTDEGKKLAIKRHEFLELYLEEFYLEWNGLK